MGGSTSRHHPAAAAENRRTGARHRAPHLDPFQSRLSLAERLRRRLHRPALLKKPASYRTRTSNQNRGPALHVKCAQKSLPVPGWPFSVSKIRCIAPAAKTSRLPTIPQPQFRTREKSGLAQLGTPRICGLCHLAVDLTSRIEGPSMLVVMQSHATEEQVRRVCQRIESLGLKAHPIPGSLRTAIGITGNKGELDLGVLESLPGVVECIPVRQPYS